MYNVGYFMNMQAYDAKPISTLFWFISVELITSTIYMYQSSFSVLLIIYLCVALMEQSTLWVQKSESSSPRRRIKPEAKLLSN